MNLYDWYKFHKGEFEEDITEYKGYRIEIHYNHSNDEYSSDAFDLIAQQYVFYPCIFMKHSNIDDIIKASIDNIDKKIELNDRNIDILIYTDNETKN